MIPDHSPELSIVLPCLDEARTIAGCVSEAHAALASADIVGEVVVADNGSRDDSARIAREAGARVVNVLTRGYGSALLGGVVQSRGRYVLMGDADGSYDFGVTAVFLQRLRAGDVLVIGNRFRGHIASGAMPWLHRHVGNPGLSAIGKRLFAPAIGDFHCGIRAFHRQTILDLDLRSQGMEFATEMIIKAALRDLPMSEIPVSLRRDGRLGPSHLRTWSDGMRHLRLLFASIPLLWAGTTPSDGQA